MVQENEDDISPISGCEGNQRRGLLLYPPFLAPCGCWDDLLLPIGTLTFLAKKAFQRQLAKRAIIVLTVRIASRKFAITTANRYISLITGKIKYFTDRINDLKNKIKKAMQDLLDQMLRELGERLKTYRSVLKSHLKRWRRYSVYQIQKGFSDAEMSKKFFDYDFLKASVATPVDGHPGVIYKKIYDTEQELKQLTDSGLPNPLPLSITDLKRDLAAAERELTEIRPEIKFGNLGTIPANKYELQQKDLEAFVKDLSNDIKITKDDIRELERFPESLDTTISRYPDAISAVAALLTDILNIFSAVGPHACREGTDGVELNENTCKCDICPPDKQLCVPLTIDPGLRLPWTKIADSANYCLPPCCDGRLDSDNVPLRTYQPTIKNFSGGGIADLLGVPPCACRCPTDALGQERILRPCVTSECNDGYACASDNFPDDNCKSIFGYFWPSKFYWYDGSDPNKPWCGWRCKEEKTDAECSSMYGEFAKWDTRNAYCSCICKEKSETNCPEKATYTVIDSYHKGPNLQGYCEEINDPTEPQCSCVCEDRECPPGQTLQKEMFDVDGQLVENACECISTNLPCESCPSLEGRTLRVFANDGYGNDIVYYEGPAYYTDGSFPSCVITSYLTDIPYENGGDAQVDVFITHSSGCGEAVISYVNVIYGEDCGDPNVSCLDHQAELI